jgi:CheY-like chemotaxis protein
MNSEINCKVRVAHTGKEACEMLFDSGEPLPAFIILALDLPELDGCGVLTRIRNHNETKRIPVIVLSNSNESSIAGACFDLHANSYVHKDPDLEVYETRLKLVLYYWIAVNRNVNT